MTDYLPPGRFLGTSVARWDAGPFELSESIYSAHALLPPHAHARAYLTLVVRGGHRESVGKYERECRPASVVFHPRSECHGNRFSAAGGRIFRLEMPDEWLNHVRECGARLDAPVESRSGVLPQIAARIFEEFRTRDSLSPLMIEGLALEFAMATERATRSTGTERSPKWLRAVIEYLHAHAAGELRLADVARVAQVHPAHLTRVFRSHFRCSVGQYTRRVRVELATRELIATRRPIAEIASSTGFADQSHFSRVFKSVTGVSPARYRTTMRID